MIISGWRQRPQTAAAELKGIRSGPIIGEEEDAFLRRAAGRAEAGDEPFHLIEGGPLRWLLGLWWKKNKERLPILPFFSRKPRGLGKPPSHLQALTSRSFNLLRLSAKVCGSCLDCFTVFLQLLPIRFTQQTRVALANLRCAKNWNVNRTSPLFSYGYQRCLFVGLLTWHINHPSLSSCGSSHMIK